MTPEQKQRLQNLKDQAARRTISGTPTWSDIHFLLSLVKSQEAGGGFARSVAETIAADLGYQGGPRNQRALAATIETALTNFTASMRSACMEKVGEMAKNWEVRSRQEEDFSLLTRHYAANEIIAALESVSIQEQEK